MKKTQKPTMTDSENTAPDAALLSGLAQAEAAPETPVDSSPGDATEPVEYTPTGRIKRKYGPRKPKTDAPLLQLPREIFKDVIKAPYSAVAARYGEHWHLSDPEAEGMIDAHIALLQQYAPQFLKEHPALSTVLILHGMALVSRFSIHYKMMREAREQRDNEVLAGPQNKENVSNQDSVGQARFGKIRPSA